MGPCLATAPGMLDPVSFSPVELTPAALPGSPGQQVHLAWSGPTRTYTWISRPAAPRLEEQPRVPGGRQGREKHRVLVRAHSIGAYSGNGPLGLPPPPPTESLLPCPRPSRTVSPLGTPSASWRPEDMG